VARPCLAWLAAASLVAFAAVASAGATGGGALDPSFGGDGKVTVDLGGGDNALGVALAGDGKLVAAGGTQDADGRVRFAVMRLNLDGALDPTFDGDGRVVTDFGSTRALAFALAAQPDGKVVVAGNVLVGRDELRFALARYNVDGSLDPTFGIGGKVVTSFGEQSSADAVLVQPDGKIVAAGIAYAKTHPCCAPSDFALARYNADGNLDTTFSGDGKVITDFGQTEFLNGLALQPDGKIVLVGATNDDPKYEKNTRVALARYSPDGALDPGFDGDGRVVTDLPNGDESGGGIAIGSGGSLVVAAGRAILQYRGDGSLDARFAGNGVVAVPDGVFSYSVALQRNGTIVIFGPSTAGSDFAVARLLPDGKVDIHFGTGGVATTDFGADEYPRSLVIQPDGKIVAAGGTTTGVFGSDDASFARYLPGTCSVPQLHGATLAVARERLAAGNCRTGHVRAAFSKRIKRGQVVSQTPKAGRQAGDWAMVDLVVSRGRRR
jgi:uncharacterized delta-60 repeat protein